MAIEPFRIAIPEADLDDLRVRLARARLPDDLEDAGWRYGMPSSALRDVLAYWRDGYDWRAQEARLAAFPQFTTEAAGERVHFFHVRSPEPDAVPLVLTHGWPGSPVEFLGVMGPLADPRAHGGDPADAFHVVCPSMPGYGFSGPTTRPGVDVHRVADAVAALMRQLGYERYVAQGGDWGALVTRRLGEAYADRLLGVHLNMGFAMPDDLAAPEAWEGVTDEEKAAFAEAGARIADGTGYMAIQSTKPNTLGLGLNDSPAGLAGWILEKFHAWSDLRPDGRLESVYALDDLLTNVMQYWWTGTAASAARLYCESARAGTAATDPWRGRVDVPTGFARYPRELLQTPRAWMERRYRLVHFAQMERGGHFAAFEQPEAFVRDLRAFARILRQETPS
ncbi:MAG: epoxide hydrolase [Myxococcota bacterium]|nr:epoxide hydrolase [Myxococcales bacterium]